MRKLTCEPSPCNPSRISSSGSPVCTASCRAGIVLAPAIAGEFESVTRINVKDQQRTWTAPSGTLSTKTARQLLHSRSSQKSLQAGASHIGVMRNRYTVCICTFAFGCLCTSAGTRHDDGLLTFPACRRTSEHPTLGAANFWPKFRWASEDVREVSSRDLPPRDVAHKLRTTQRAQTQVVDTSK